MTGAHGVGSWSNGILRQPQRAHPLLVQSVFSNDKTPYQRKILLQPLAVLSAASALPRQFLLKWYFVFCQARIWMQRKNWKQLETSWTSTASSTPAACCAMIAVA